MNRRNFLSLLGRSLGVTAVDPKLAGKVVQGALTKSVATAVASKIPLNLAIFNYYKNIVLQAQGGINNLPAENSTGQSLAVLVKSLNQNKIPVSPFLSTQIGLWLKSHELYKAGKSTDIPEFDKLEMGSDEIAQFLAHDLIAADVMPKEAFKLMEDEFGWDESWFDPEANKEEEKKEEERQEYEKTAKDIDYSRMDKAGSAEDEGYAKYYEELKQFGTLLENMNRRGFLKMLGKGAAAATGQSLVPKGVVGSVLKGALGGIPNKTVTFLTSMLGKHLLYNPVVPTWYIDWDWKVDPTNDLKTFNSTVAEYKSILSNLQKSGVVVPANMLSLISGVINKTNNLNQIINNHIQNPTKYTEKLTNDNISKIVQSLYGEGGEIIDFNNELLRLGFKNNLIDLNTQLNLEKEFGVFKCDYVNDSESKARKDEFENEINRINDNIKKRKEKEQYYNTAKDINYSRMDKAGGSEDTDYAKYYEKVNTFDQLLSVVKEADDDIISGDTEGIEPGETGMPRGFGHPDRNRNYDDTIRLNVIYGVPEDVDNAYNTAASKKLQQFVKQQLPWIDEYSWSIFNHPRLTFSDIASIIQNVYNDFRYWVKKEDYDKNAKHHVERKEKAMYFIQQYPNALENFSKVFKYEEFLYGDSPSNPDNISNYPLNISLYDTTRELGGHEEGGWWYDVVRLVYSIPVTNLKQAEAAAKKLYNNLNKVNINGKPTIILEKYKGSIDTTNKPRPRYE